MIDTAFIKFHQLPQDVKRAVTSPKAMQQLDAIEEKFHVALADTIVRLMVKEVAVSDLTGYLHSALQLSDAAANELSMALRTGILQPVLPYLEPTVPPTPVRPPAAPAAPPVPGLLPSVRPAPLAPVRGAPAVPPQPAGPLFAAPAVRQMSRPVPAPLVVAPPVPSERPSPARLQPSRRGTAAYYISAEDEEEIAKHRDRLQRISNVSPTADLAGNIEGIIQRTPLPAADEPMRERLRALLLSRLRDVRTADELGGLLARPAEQGGMGYPPQVTRRVLTETDAVARTLHDREVAGYLADPASAQPVQPVAPPTPLTTPAAVPIKIPEPVHMAPKPEAAAVEPPVPAPPPIQSRPPVRRTVPQTAGRRVIQDIKGPDRPVSLVDELGLLSLDDFRTLGKDLRDSAAKVAEKIELLAEESYEQRAAGVAAWRRSSPHELYLAMGRESMAGNRTIEEVAADRRRRNLPYLTAGEFAAIADLNRQISS
ncbi:MAG: hypothetical protein HY340_01140 [Candidatus Kerfeldbacteria bacterium]|nr:hypothetical protein [Candidatus Kerfeldbacteria bacterium]